MKTTRRGLLALAGGALHLRAAGRVGATGAAGGVTQGASFVTRWTAAYTGNHVVNALSTREDSYLSVGTIRESSPLCDESWIYTGFAIGLDGDGRRRWTVTATEVGYDYSFRDVAPTADGGALVVGSRREVDEDNSPFHTGIVVSVGPDGTERWRKYYGALDDDKFIGVAPLSDGEFLVLGRSGDEGDIKRPYVRRIDDRGAVLEERFVDREPAEGYRRVANRPVGVVSTGEGAALLTNVYSWAPRDDDDRDRTPGRGMLVRVGGDAGERWRTDVGTDRFDRFGALRWTRDGFLAAGIVRDRRHDEATDGVVARIDDGGAERWTTVVARDDNTYLHDCTPYDDGYVAVGSEQRDDELDALYVRLDPDDGTVTAAETNETGHRRRHSAVTTGVDGGILLATYGSGAPSRYRRLGYDQPAGGPARLTDEIDTGVPEPESGDCDEEAGESERTAAPGSAGTGVPTTTGLDGGSTSTRPAQTPGDFEWTGDVDAWQGLAAAGVGLSVVGPVVLGTLVLASERYGDGDERGGRDGDES